MRERLDETIQIPEYSEALINTDSATVGRIKAEREHMDRAIAVANKRHAALVASWHSTFAYRVSQILADPEVTLPPLPRVDSEITG